ncbi:hypothetical protein BGAL_0496g00040 [Botrytis galanthina]|uniref:2EXR domain-containing protein n=1 Tax=Botrytis galanthina TaxID=278940 RepID=A0A4S8QLB7_9HELO|nr:hypothetical protein BGAL_0496g00040 [Botrytis galanthina]
MFLQSEESQSANLPSTPLISVPGPLEEFAPFSRLPLELRRKIWGFAALSHPRIFELVWCSSEDDLHLLFKVSKQTNCVPPIMEVNREARQEGMRIFEKRVFNNCNIDIEIPFKLEGEKPQCTWFNPDLDTIYFGENTCIRTVADFLDLYWQTTLPNIAFALEVHLHGSCRCGWISADWDPGNRVVTSLQVLHGKPQKDRNWPMFPGSSSTREVSIVLPSFVYRYAAGEMPNTITFRPSVNDVLEIGGVRIGAEWAYEIQEIRSGLNFGCGPSKWKNDSCPDFSFVSFAPSYKDGKGKKLRHAGFLISSKDCEKITANGGAFLEDLKLRTGVDIRFGYCSDSDAYARWFKAVNEVGLFNGTDEGIKQCEFEILAHCLNAR